MVSPQFKDGDFEAPEDEVKRAKPTVMDQPSKPQQTEALRHHRIPTLHTPEYYFFKNYSILVKSGGKGHFVYAWQVYYH